ncbi:MAG: hypothetical protein HRU72_12770 [Planctomycetia bacterium]|nr:tetratricopeptide repeat protein [Candidatus Brocadia sp.]QOJ07352.1 MAG: hypothetical protein HRU72_12770 [Planctomycetia bacterium]HQU30386.1 tetratricopeptide repeat protein [Candidatus Brocadia sapporoensis]
MRLIFSIAVVFGIVVLAHYPSFAIEKVEGISNPDQSIYDLSERVLQDLEWQYDTEQLRECMGFYIDNQQFDSPQGSYNNAIRIGYQIVAINHKDIDTYTTMAWLLWSKWVSWTKNPNRMPDGERKADQAVELLNWGEKWNQKSVRFYKESADTIWPLAKYHRTDFYKFVIENYRKAELLSGANDLSKVRIRLNLGHAYRQIREKKTAIYWYKKVLEIAPTNETAIRYLAHLENEPDKKNIY